MSMIQITMTTDKPTAQFELALKSKDIEIID